MDKEKQLADCKKLYQLVVFVFTIKIVCQLFYWKFNASKFVPKKIWKVKNSFKYMTTISKLGMYIYGK